MSIQCMDRRSGIDRRQNAVDDKCSMHDQCEKMYDFRFGTQDNKIDKVERIIETLANNILTFLNILHRNIRIWKIRIGINILQVVSLKY